MPSRGPEGAKQHLGRVVELKREILVVSYFTTPVTFEVGAKIGQNQHVVRRLTPGARIKIRSIKAHRMPLDIYYSYRCVEIETGLVFDLGFNMKDAVGL